MNRAEMTPHLIEFLKTLKYHTPQIQMLTYGGNVAEQSDTVTGIVMRFNDNNKEVELRLSAESPEGGSNLIAQFTGVNPDDTGWLTVSSD